MKYCIIILAVLTGCQYADVGELIAPQLAPSPWERGERDSVRYITEFEAVYGHSFGGDKSILMWIQEFDIPLCWKNWQKVGGKWFLYPGDIVTEDDFGTESACHLTLGTMFDFSRFTPYLYGVTGNTESGEE